MTKNRVLLHPAALAEAEAAVRWYRERSPKTAARFVAEISAVVDKVAAAPKRWIRGVHGTRKAKLPCFPFLIIYRESENAVQILAVAHGRRRPGYWKNRR